MRSKKRLTKHESIRTEARAAHDEVRRRMISECVCLLIDKVGLEGVTLRRIAAELGCTTGMIVRYFTTKDELLEGALQIALQRLSKAVTKQQGVPRDLKGMIGAFVEALPFNDEQRLYWRVYVAYRSVIGSHASYSSKAVHSWAHDVYVSLRQSLADDLHLPYESPEVALVSDALAVLVDGFGIGSAFEPERYTRERVRVMIEGCLRGLLAAASIDEFGEGRLVEVGRIVHE